MAKKTSFGPDPLNQKILQVLRYNSRVPTAEIGRRVGLSAPAVAERIARMEQDGVIQGYQTVVNLDKLGLAVRVFLSFKSKMLGHREMVEMVDSMPEIQEWYTITGDSCMLLKIAVASTRELERTIEKLAMFGETTTQIILSEKRTVTTDDSR